MVLWNWFLPHKDTHKKAHLISWEALVIYVLLFILLQVSFSIVNYIKPGVLGISGDIDQHRLIELTNQEREKAGLAPLRENSALDSAAQAKAANMFSENYWAHFAPSGKTPWDFIIGSGYRFTYAGENLAKNFYRSDDAVIAWMASPTHRENILSSKYVDTGIAVTEGILNGQKTTLIVQMFGNTSALAAAPPSVPSQAPTVNVGGTKMTVPEKDMNSKPQLMAVLPTQKITTQPLFDPFLISKVVSMSVILMVVILLAVDFVILRRRGVFRLSSHHLAHMSVLTAAAAAIISIGSGGIL